MECGIFSWPKAKIRPLYTYVLWQVTTVKYATGQSHKKGFETMTGQKKRCERGQVQNSPRKDEPSILAERKPKLLASKAPKAAFSFRPIFPSYFIRPLWSSPISLRKVTLEYTSEEVFSLVRCGRTFRGRHKTNGHILLRALIPKQRAPTNQPLPDNYSPRTLVAVHCQC